MRRGFLVGLTIYLLVAGFSLAQQVQVREEFLANGMKILMVERHDSPSVWAGWVAHVGSVNESPGITGISHLFEHMMFKGTKTIGTNNYAKDAEILAQQDALRMEMEKEFTLLREKLRRGEIAGSIYETDNMTPRLRELKTKIEELYKVENDVIVKDELLQIYTREGASGLNAVTGEDQTMYYITLPSNRLELWFWLESDRLANPVFREFYAERDVVREERRLRVESTPTGKIEEAFEAMFWQSSPYSHWAIGWPSDVESISRSQAEKYFATFYAPNNITAVLVGDFDQAKVMDLAKTYFERIPRGSTPPPEMITSEVPQPAQKRLTAEADTNPEVIIRFHTAPFNHKDSFPLNMVAGILNGRTGRLYKALVEEKNIANSEPSATFSALKYEGYFELDAEIKENVQPDIVEAALIMELDKLAQESVGERELQKVKNQAQADSFRRLQDSSFLHLQLLYYDSLGDWRYLNSQSDKTQAVTVADVQRVAKKYFYKENRTVATYIRKVGGASEDPALATLPAQMKAMIKQQLAQIEQETDRAMLDQDLASMQQDLGQVPAEIKPALELLIKKAQKRIESLPVETTPKPGQSGQKPKF